MTLNSQSKPQDKGAERLEERTRLRVPGAFAAHLACFQGRARPSTLPRAPHLEPSLPGFSYHPQPLPSSPGARPCSTRASPLALVPRALCPRAQSPGCPHRAAATRLLPSGDCGGKPQPGHTQFSLGPHRALTAGCSGREAHCCTDWASPGLDRPGSHQVPSKHLARKPLIPEALYSRGAELAWPLSLAPSRLLEPRPLTTSHAQPAPATPTPP